jgi:predicted DNA binding CopG/RHH family protein
METLQTTNKKSQLIVRMTTDELNSIKGAAQSKGMTVSKYVREIVLTSASNAIVG